MAIGTALSGISFKKLGFYGVYAVSAAIYVTGLVYGAACVAEVSPPNRPAAEPRRKSRGGPFRGFFDVRHVKEAFHVTFKDGPHNRKLRIVMLMCIAFLIMGPINGSLRRFVDDDALSMGTSERRGGCYVTFDAVLL